VLLHDIGKIRELHYARSFGYTTEGQLLGHIQIGAQMVLDKLRLMPDFPPRLRDLVVHMILSHHGELAFGSPKLPMFPEALLLHLLDNMDSKMECMRALIDRDPQVQGVWTGYNSALDRTALKKQKYLDPMAEAAPQQASQQAPQQAIETSAPKPNPPRPPEPASAFADKLRGALGNNS
jgi:3'-5' exoribonuclease